MVRMFLSSGMYTYNSNKLPIVNHKTFLQTLKPARVGAQRGRGLRFRGKRVLLGVFERVLQVLHNCFLFERHQHSAW